MQCFSEIFERSTLFWIFDLRKDDIDFIHGGSISREKEKPKKSPSISRGGGASEEQGLVTSATTSSIVIVLFHFLLHFLFDLFYFLDELLHE